MDIICSLVCDLIAMHDNGFKKICELPTEQETKCKTVGLDFEQIKYLTVNPNNLST